MEEILGRIKVAVEFLKDGKSFTVGGLRLGIVGKDDLSVTGWSPSIDFGSVTKGQSIKELEDIKILFMEMVYNSIELRDFIEGKNVEYFLYFDDYGKASIPICSEIDGVIYFDAEIKP